MSFVITDGLSGAKSWFVLRIRTGRELVVHELLAEDGFEVYTPFINRRQLRRVKKSKKGKGQKAQHFHYAEPIIPGWLLVSFDPQDRQKLATLIHHVQQRDYIHAIITRGQWLYSFTDHQLMAYRTQLSELALTNRRIVARGYDPKRDSRKNKQRSYAQKEIPVVSFAAGELVEFIEGAWSGVTMAVSSCEDGVVQLEAEVLGRVSRLVAHAVDLRPLAGNCT